MSKKGTRRDGHESPKGTHTLAEILSQPVCWTDSFKMLEEQGTLRSLATRLSEAQEWVFMGCGSSFYIAQSAAAAMTDLTGLRAQALPASEVLLFPHLGPAFRTGTIPVLISRSGQTSEVLKAAQQFRERGLPRVGITCARGQALEELVTSPMVIPEADEQSMVMTRSFTTMLSALQTLAAQLRNRQDFLASWPEIVLGGERLMQTLPRRVSEFVNQSDFDDYVCLGQGGLYGIACESALKLTEMSVSYAQSFHTLEFRHGPKSIVGKRTLIVFLLSESSYSAELEVLEEVKKLGGTTLVVTNHADQCARAAADLLVELEVDAPETARLPLYVIAGQLMGLYTGIRKGHDPDRPRNLSRVVVLEDEGRSATPHHAAI